MEKVPVVPGLSRKEIEEKTVSLISAVQPEALRGNEPVDVEEIFEFYIPDKYKTTTLYTDLSFLGEGVLGYTNAQEKTSCVDKSLSDATDQPTIRRFRSTVAHEIGHCIYHVPVLNFFQSTSLFNEGLYRVNRKILKPYLDPEWQAWEFARALLMPRHLIINYYQKGYSIYDMAESFDLNPAFIDVRLKTLKISP